MLHTDLIGKHVAPKICIRFFVLKKSIVLAYFFELKDT